MSSFEQLEAQLSQDPTDVKVKPVFDMLDQQVPGAGGPASRPVVEPQPGIMERAQGRLTDTLAGLTGLESEQAAMLGDDPDKWDLSPGDAFVQTVGGAAEAVWDKVGEVIVDTAGLGWEILPENVQNVTKEQLNHILESKDGKAAISALSRGGKVWDDFADAQPQLAKTLEAAFNIVGTGLYRKLGNTAYNAGLKLGNKVSPTVVDDLGLPDNMVTKLPGETGKAPVTPQPRPDVKPAWQVYQEAREGQRTRMNPAAGGDNDLFNMLAPEMTPDEAAKLAGSQQVTNPTGIFGNQQAIPSPHMWSVIDEVKKTSVSPTKTMQENANILSKTIDNLNKATVQAARKQKGVVDNDVILGKLDESLNLAKQKDKGVFGLEGNKGANTVEDLKAQLLSFIQEEGASYEGILKARQRFDNYMLNKQKAGTWTGRKSSVATEVHEAFRTALNDIVKSGVPEAAALLNRQHLLFTGLKGISPKAAKEAKSAFGRALQRLGIHKPTTPVAQFAMGAMIHLLAPALAGISAGQFATKWALKNKVSGTVRSKIAYTIREIQDQTKDILPKLTPAERVAARNDLAIMQSLLDAMEDEKGEEIE